MMKRTISGMIGAGSLAHNRRDFIAENVDPRRVHLNICYQNENLKDVYKELFDDSVERYNIGKRKDRQITNYYEKIRQGKQEKLFHEVIFQIGNREDMAVGTMEGDLAVKVLDEYARDFQKRNPTLRVFSCYLHQDEATPHLHIDFIPYVAGWQGKGMDTRVSLKQALKSLGFQGGNKHDTELNQWINHEKEVLAEIAKQQGIEWEQKGTHEEHLSVYDYKKKVRSEEVKALEKENIILAAENENLIGQVAEVRADMRALEKERVEAEKEVEQAKIRAEKAEIEAKKHERRLDNLKPIIDSMNVETEDFKEKIEEQLPLPGTLELASTYREKKAKPLFIRMKNKMASLAVKLEQTTRELKKATAEIKKLKKEKKVLAEENKLLLCKNEEIQGESKMLKSIAVMFDRVVRVIGEEAVLMAVREDEAREQREILQKKASEKEKSILKRLDTAKTHVAAREENRAKGRTKKSEREMLI